MSKLYVGSLLYGCNDIALQSINSILSSSIQESTTFFVLDNGSPNKDEIAVVLSRAESYTGPHKVNTHVNPSNLGVSGGMNCLFRKAFSDPECQWMIYCAQDVIVHPEGIQRLVDRAKRGDAHFITGCQVRENPLPEPRDYEGVGALFMGHFLISRKLYEDIGPWDEKFFPAYFEDNDYHNRIIIAGYHKAAIGSFLSPVHHASSSTIRKYPALNANFSKNASYFRSKWGGGPADTLKKLVAEHGDKTPVTHVLGGKEINEGPHPKSS